MILLKVFVVMIFPELVEQQDCGPEDLIMLLAGI